MFGAVLKGGVIRSTIGHITTDGKPGGKAGKLL
jgi:hypothetical protein